MYLWYLLQRYVSFLGGVSYISACSLREGPLSKVCLLHKQVLHYFVVYCAIHLHVSAKLGNLKPTNNALQY